MGDKVVLREVGPGLYHAHENPNADSAARRKFEAAITDACEDCPHDLVGHHLEDIGGIPHLICQHKDCGCRLVCEEVR